MCSTATAVQSISWVGVDVSADTFDTCCCPPECDPSTPAELRRLRTNLFKRTEEGAAEFLGTLPTDTPAQLVMESTGRYSSQLATWILVRRLDLVFSFVNPRRVSDYAKTLGLRSKTDPICARVIASYAAKMKPQPWNHLPQQYLQLQTMVRIRQGLVEQRTTVKNQLGDLARETLASTTMANLKLTLSSVEQVLLEQIKQIEAYIEQLLAQHMDIKADRDLGCTIPGVGRIVSTGLLGELGDLRRFKARKKIDVFSGVNVGRHTSGRTVNKTLGLSKEGSARIRRLLFLAAMAASKGENALARYYRRMIARDKKKKVALASLMRKILNIYRRLIIDGCEYRDELVEPRPAGRKRRK